MSRGPWPSASSRSGEMDDVPITPNIPKLFFEALAGRVDVQHRNSRHVPGADPD